VTVAAPGIILAAPASGSGKTLLTLGLLAALRQRGVRVGPAKVGPDYIDPAFHSAAAGREGTTLDSWAMRTETFRALAAAAAEGVDLVLCEGVMGLLDGAEVAPGQGDGSTAEVAALTGWPVVLAIDARGMAASAAAVVAGFVAARPDIKVVGAIFNRVGGDKHRRMIRSALTRLCPGVAALGFVPHLDELAVPSRHLGLVQAREHPDLAAFVAAAALAVADAVDLAALTALARPGPVSGTAPTPLAPLGSRIAVAEDDAFAFRYPATLAGWRRAGAEIALFSPLADQAPAASCDAVYLPGGYPELHAGRLAANGAFLAGLRAAAARGAVVFGECGGYMTMGRILVDADGVGHAMAGLLPVETSFATRRRQLGYRSARLLAAGPLGAVGQRFRGHEFHFATILAEGGERLFALEDAAGGGLPQAGCRAGGAMGSFLHLIDRA
jgi:cobyrinic acid a,c-diamide synthase